MPATQVVQFAVDSLLDGRPVTTLSAGKLVPWTVGIDKDDGYITTAAAQFLKQTDKALPDDGTFAGDATHPDMVLHFSNAASSTSPQARGVSGVGSFEFDVPHASYSELYLAVVSSYGDSPLTATLTYSDSSSGKLAFTLPDWGTGSALPANPPIFFNLISGLHKWNKDNASVDTPTHTITGVKVTADSSKELSRVRIDKAGQNSYLVFWGATGVATSPISNSNGGAGGNGGTSGYGGAGAIGGGGASAGQAGAATSGAGGGAAGSTNSEGGAVLGGATNSNAGAPNSSAGTAGAAVAPAATSDSAGCALGPRRGSNRTSALYLLALCGLLSLRRATTR